MVRIWRLLPQRVERLGWGGGAAMAEKRLAKEIAEQFLTDDESVGLEEFTELGVGPAQIFPSKPI